MIEEVLRVVNDRQAYFWATHSGPELDQLRFVAGQGVGVEVKYADAVTLTRSMHTALSALKLDRLLVVYPDKQSYPLGPQAEAVAFVEVRDKLKAI